VCVCCCLLQASALQELQKRFETQEHQLAAATATAASTTGAEGVQVEPYFPEDKVQQELTMLHKVRVCCVLTPAAAAGSCGWGRV
jgi:hypothetical protein